MTGVQPFGRGVQEKRSFAPTAYDIARVSAGSLVLASTGMGATFAWSVGSEHSYAFAALTLLFAVGLELAKPLSVQGCFQAFGSWKIVRGLALGLLATVAISYSLTAELSLLSQTRGDATSKRSADSYSAQAQRDAYEAAKKELSELAPSRPVGDAKAEITALLAANPKANGCEKIDGPVSREVCPKVAVLQGEIERSDRRKELQRIINGYVQRASSGSEGEAVLVADPGSHALVTYLGTIGVVVPEPIMREYLVLVGVIALELGSALALVLVASFAPVPVPPVPALQPTVPMPTPETSARNPDVDRIAEIKGAESLTSGNQSAAGSPITAPRRNGNRSRVSEAILSHLRSVGGSLTISERKLSKAIGLERNTARRVLKDLAKSGLLSMTPTKRGSVLKLL